MKIALLFVGILYLSGDTFALNLPTENSESDQLGENEVKLLARYRNLALALRSKVNDLEAVISELREELHSAQTQNCTDQLKKLPENTAALQDVLEKHVSDVNKQVKNIEENTTSGNIDLVNIPNFESFRVLRNNEIAGPGWIVIQQRIRGDQDFNVNWEAYKNGFGDFDGDFFLGLERIHRLTTDTPYELYIHMEWFNGTTFFARYDNFTIAGKDDKYRVLSLGTYSGSPSNADRMRDAEHKQFSTFDSDNDQWSYNCANELEAGWWFSSCSTCNLNGKYYPQETYNYKANWWYPQISLKTIKMLIQPRSIDL